MRADLLDRQPGIPSVAQHVGVGEQATQVRVTGLILGQQDQVSIAGRRGLCANRHRGSQDGLDPVSPARRNEPRGSVETIPVGERYRRHP